MVPHTLFVWYSDPPHWGWAVWVWYMPCGVTSDLQVFKKLLNLHSVQGQKKGLNLTQEYLFVLRTITWNYKLVDIVTDGVSWVIQFKNINGSSLQVCAWDKSPAWIYIVLLLYSRTQHTKFWDVNKLSYVSSAFNFIRSHQLSVQGVPWQNQKWI